MLWKPGRGLDLRSGFWNSGAWQCVLKSKSSSHFTPSIKKLKEQPKGTLWDRYPRTMNLLYSHGKSTPREFSAWCALWDPIGMWSDTQRSRTENRKSTELMCLTSEMPAITTLSHGWEIQEGVTLPLHCAPKTSYPGGGGGVGSAGAFCLKGWQSGVDCKLKANCHCS